MRAFRTLTSPAGSLPDANIDTDVIFPARFLLLTSRDRFGRFAFHDRRSAGAFALADAVAGGARILVAGANFGCGSSREQAPWALLDWGIEAIIAPSYGEIFRSNCFKNGLLAVTLPAPCVSRLREAALSGDLITVDLETQKVQTPTLGAIAFEIEPDKRETLLNGWDEIDQIMARSADAIHQFEIAQRTQAPWLWAQEAEETDRR